MRKIKQFRTFVKENFEQPGWASDEETKPEQRLSTTHFHDEELSDEEQLYMFWLNNIEDDDYYDDDNYDED
jgi:hypothetical protein